MQQTSHREKNGTFRKLRTLNIGERYEAWTVVGEERKIGQQYGYMCRCKCGVERSVRRYQLTKGKSKSCGCVAVKHARIANTTHGMTNTPTFESWNSMKDRCYHPGRNDAASYYLKGISVCSRWLGKNGFMNFFEDMGERPEGHTLDRVDPDGNYEPSNCRWATPKQQARNKSSTKKYEIDGKQLIATDIAAAYGMGVDTLLWRYRAWGNMERAAKAPLRQQVNSRLLKHEYYDEVA